jgi:Acyl-CoA reductase (LuxC)
MTDPLLVTHVAHGRMVRGRDLEFTSRSREVAFATPKINVEDLVWPRPFPGPAFDLPMTDVVDFLVATGAELNVDTNEHLRAALESTCRINNLAPDALRSSYDRLADFFDRQLLEFDIAHGLGVATEWRSVGRPSGTPMAVRAYPLRLLHFLAGNGPPLAALSIARGALTRGVNMLKLPSSDLFTAPAILATMADLDADHPVLRSFSAAYWRGGDDAVEALLFRKEYFDTVVAWGGESAIRNVHKYIGPGLDLVALNPKESASLIGREAFADPRTTDFAARCAALDVGSQEACQDSRFQFVEGTDSQVDDFCDRLHTQIRQGIGATPGRPTPPEIRHTLGRLREEHADIRVWGQPDGCGLVVRSREPLDMYPIGRTVNVVAVRDLADAARYINVGTQTVGIYPADRKATLREVVFSAGAQRVVTLGGVSTQGTPYGRPHDGYYLLARMVRWVCDEDLPADANTTDAQPAATSI